MTSSPQRQFSEAIADLHLRAGAPSSRTVASRIGKISHATINRTIKGLYVPSWSITEKIVRELNGDLPKFQNLWIAVQKQPGVEPPSAEWAPVLAEDLALGDHMLLDGEWSMITAIGSDAQGIHVHIGRVRLDFVPGTSVMIRAEEKGRSQ